jgi:hypothetical protein
MNGWLIALCAWGVLSVTLALVLGRAIRMADRLEQPDRENHGDVETRLPSPREEEA